MALHVLAYNLTRVYARIAGSLGQTIGAGEKRFDDLNRLRAAKKVSARFWRVTHISYGPVKICTQSPDGIKARSRTAATGGKALMNCVAYPERA
jgi:hypothetical protein